MTLEELARELADPAIAPERLILLARDLKSRFNEALESAEPSIMEAVERVESGPDARATALSLLPAELREMFSLLDMLAAHPGMSLPGLRRLLLRHDEIVVTHWFNPLVPLLLMSEPSPLYMAAAARSLHNLAPLTPACPPLAELLSSWHAIAQQAERTEHELKAIHLARHLAHLFSLPWPGP